MATNIGPKADGVNTTETSENALGSPRGGRPISFKPIRKRGYHRALKSGKSWAIVEQSIQKISDQLVTFMYKTYFANNILEDNKLLGLFKWLPDESYNVKVEYGTVPSNLSLWQKFKLWFQS